ncbi:MAG: DUF6582 domain-containing protein, partial [Bryobacteraceae bacterium]
MTANGCGLDIASGWAHGGFTVGRRRDESRRGTKRGGCYRDFGNRVAYSISMSKITEGTREHLADADFAFPKERKEPVHDAAHVRNAVARFKQVEGVTDAERDAAWKRIE